MHEHQRIWQSVGLRHVFVQDRDSSHVSSRDDQKMSFCSKESFSASLPDPFQFYWQRSHQPIRIVWTYWELDEDTRGMPNSERIQLWKNIMRSKSWTAEHVCFWPIAVQTARDSSLLAQPNMLFSLIKFCLPSFVLCFGQQCHTAIQNYFLQTGDTLPEQCTILYLPGAQDMLPDNHEAKIQTWRLIKDLQL